MLYQRTHVLIIPTRYLIGCVPNPSPPFFTGIRIFFFIITPVISIYSIIPDIVTSIIGVLLFVYEVVVINFVIIAGKFEVHTILVVQDAVTRDDIFIAGMLEPYADIVVRDAVTRDSVSAG